jgi:2-haloacid dehalogenase
MLGLSGPKRPKMMAFDIIGTVFPLEPLRPSIVALGLPPTGLEGWFAAGCRDAFAMAAVGDFAPFKTVLEAALDGVLAEQGLDAPADERKALLEKLETLDARDGAREAFLLLADIGIPVMARSGLIDLVQEVVSVDEVKLAKPRGEVYAHAAQKAGVDRAELALVAAHPWDINGAASAGLVTTYLAADRPYSRVMRKPDMEALTLPEIGRRLAAL